MKDFKSKFAPVIIEYLEHRETLRYSTCHEVSLALFDAYCFEHHPNIETLTKEVVRGWVNYETSRGRGGMYNIISAIRLLAQYVGNGSYILPTTAVAKRPVSVPYILTDDELSRLFFAADNLKSSCNPFLKLIFPTLLRLMYTCGLRPHEVRLIKRDNINFSTGEILIDKAKRHKERIVVMSDDMLKQCRKYDLVRTASSIQSKYFFPRSDGECVKYQQLINLYKRCWTQANPDIPANILPKLTPYSLRHRFASAILQKWLSEKRDFYAMLPYLRAFMGHEKFSDTAYYIHLLPENLLCSPGVDWSIIDDMTPEVNVWES